MIWLSVTSLEWRKARLVSIGGKGGGSIAAVANPFGSALVPGTVGKLCTGPTVWSFVVVSGGRPGEETTIELRDASPYDEGEHGAMR